MNADNTMPTEPHHEPASPTEADTLPHTLPVGGAPRTPDVSSPSAAAKLKENGKRQTRAESRIPRPDAVSLRCNGPAREPAASLGHVPVKEDRPWHST